MQITNWMLYIYKKWIITQLNAYEIMEKIDQNIIPIMYPTSYCMNQI